MLAPNTLLQNRYRIVRAIGEGGMGAVYAARDERLGSTVALKETLLCGGLARTAFEHEARLLASLCHPALPVVSDYFSEADGQFLVMQFVPGEDLATLLGRREEPFALTEVLRWADQLLDALDYLHGRQPPIIHRDIKPQNLKLTARGEVVLLDFGLAKDGPPEAPPMAASPSIAGFTPHYAPLEQIEGEAIDARTDLYALAATLYCLLTGARPPDAVERATAVLGGQPDPLRPADELNPAVPPAIAAVLLGAMSLHPRQRPATAAAMRAVLRAAGGGPDQPADGSTLQTRDSHPNNLPQQQYRFGDRQGKQHGGGHRSGGNKPTRRGNQPGRHASLRG